MTTDCECQESFERQASNESASQRRSCCRRLAKYVVDPRRIFHRYFLLCLICSFIPGPYYHDSLLSTYKGPVSDSMHLSNKAFGMLFALSSLTGLFCGPAGAIIVHYGRTRIALGASLVCALGSLFTVLGFRWDRLEVMLAARFIFWLSLYALLMVQTLLVYSIFEGPALNPAYSLVICACRLGGVFGYFLSGPLMGRLGTEGSLWLSVALVFGAFGATLLFAYFFRGTTTAQTVRPLLGGRARAKSFSFSLVRELPRSVVFLIISLGLLYGTVFPFEVVADDMLQKDFGYSANQAGYLLTVIPAVSAASPIFAPFLGTALPQKLRSCGLGHGAMMVAQATLSLHSSWTPGPGFVLMGVGYTIAVCSLWTTLPALVRSAVRKERAKEVEGLATGLGYAAVAIGQFVSNFIVGAIKDAASYRWVCTWFACLTGAGALSVVVVAAVHRPLPPEQPASLGEAEGQRDLQREPAVVSLTPSLTDSDGGEEVPNVALSGNVEENYYKS